MNILVLNGSPKGDDSVTLQTVLYLQKKFTKDKFTFLNVGQMINSLSKNMTASFPLFEEAELILFAYPVYTFLAPYQLQKFIELLKDYVKLGFSVVGKFAAQITTSKHFYDVTAHKYIEQNCGDLGLCYIGGLSADMDDLLTDIGVEDAISFFEYVHFCYENNIYTKKQIFSPPQKRVVPIIQNRVRKSEKYKVAVVTDCTANDTNLEDLISNFDGLFPYKLNIINISDYPFAGGCLGCFKCAGTGKCVYKDGFDKFLRDKIQSCDAIIYAFNIKDHSMGSRFKLYDDRQFCNGHRTVTAGMPTAYLICGNYSEEDNLQLVINGRADVGGNFLAGVLSDESSNNMYKLETEIANLSKKLAYALENEFTLPPTFLGVGGMKIFRDLIYVMRGLMRADHKFYKENGIYNFPQKQKGLIIKMLLVGRLMSMKSVQKKMGNKMNQAILKPYKKVIEKE